MPVLKCKMCGGDLEAAEGASVGVCQYCGSTMTLPTARDEREANLFNRANHFRRQNEFDRAAGIYESILTDDPDNAEAHWGLVLCKFGIEYVEDPSTGKRIPTCHRARFASLLADPDYQLAVQNAGPEAKEVYESEGRVLSLLQRQILEISSKESPYDVFICYKETDETGGRTPDSVLAQELYFELKEAGFNVFFSRITLENKLGMSFEPYIFAALNSARVMVVVATRPEFVNAVWVRNEWSRYLSLIRSGERKTLIPAYRDMDPYDLPEEFANLQAQDMSKLGFMQDLVRGIKKFLDEEKDAETGPALPSEQPSIPTAEPLLKRGMLFLEDGDFVQADQYFERVLDLNPEEPRAYIGKLLAQLKLPNESCLMNLDQSLVENKHYQKAIRFASEPLKQRLLEYQQAILNRSNSASEAPFISLDQAGDTGEARLKTLDSLFKCKISNQTTEILLDTLACFPETRAHLIQYVHALQCRMARGARHTAVLKNDGLTAVGNNDNGQLNIQEFTELVSIAAGDYFTVGLRKDGTVLATGDNRYGQCRVSGWNQIKEISAGKYHTVGLKQDGSVVATGNNEYGQCNVTGWTHIKRISAGSSYTVGIREDGTAVAAGQNISGRCNIGNWRGLIDISAGLGHTVGLLKNGTVVATGNDLESNVSRWTNVIAVSAGNRFTIGLRADGVLYAAGDSGYSGSCLVGGWHHVIAILADDDNSFGLTTSGEVLVAGNNYGTNLAGIKLW